MEIRTSPWITDKSFFYMRDFIEKRKNVSVLEFGSGASTVWFDKNPDVQKIISVEHNEEWFLLIKEKVNPQKTQINLFPRPHNNFCKNITEKFDIIVIDGVDRNDCFSSSLSLLKDNGIVVFDNTERVSGDQDYRPSFELWSKNNFGEFKRFRQNGPDITGWRSQHKEGYWETTIFEKR